MNQKKTFKYVLAGGAILLAILPVLVTFSALLTTLFDTLEWYVILQEWIVPFEARAVAVLIRLVGIRSVITPNSHVAMLLLRTGTSAIPVDLQWNCLGWQSIVLLFITLNTGLRGPWKIGTKLEVIVLGIVGTFLVNVFRMAFIMSLAYYVNSIAAMIIHDYFAALFALIWLIFFWWFSYSFVLEPRNQTEISNS